MGLLLVPRRCLGLLTISEPIRAQGLNSATQFLSVLNTDRRHYITERRQDPLVVRLICTTLDWMNERKASTFLTISCDLVAWLTQSNNYLDHRAHI